MRSELITSQLVKRTYPGSGNPLTVKEVAEVILPKVKTFLHVSDGRDVKLTDVGGAYTLFMGNQGFEIGTLDLNLQAWNAFGVAAGEQGLAAFELSELVEMQLQWSPIGLIRSLSPEDRNQLPAEIYNLVRLEKYEHCTDI